MKKNIISLAALLIASATFVACSSDDNIIEEQPVQPTEQVYTMTGNAQKGGDAATTRALSLSGSTLNATWTAGDAVEVWTSDGTTTKYGTLTAETSGASTKLKGTLSSLPGNGQSLLLKYLSPAYATQDGTLTGSASSIDRVCDYATATVTATVVGSSVTATDANFVNQQAIVKFTLKNKADDEALSVNKLFVTAGGTTCEVTPGGSTSELYVAVPAVASGRVTLTALSGSTYYDYVKTGVTLAQSQYYAIGASLTEVKDIDYAKLASLGRVVATDRKMYASVESAANAGTTAFAVIAQAESSWPGYEFTAIAISDESSRMKWSDAEYACENKTPKFNGLNGGWLFPTIEYWQAMFAANGENSESWTGLNALITKAGGTPLRDDGSSDLATYWTATDDPSNSYYKCKMGCRSDGSVFFGTGNYPTNEYYVRAFFWWN